jgi:hypothetical protein
VRVLSGRERWRLPACGERPPTLSEGRRAVRLLVRNF